MSARATWPRVAALFVNYSSAPYLARAVHSLWAQRLGGQPADVEVSIVDNASPQLERDRPILEKLRDEYGVTLEFRGTNDGYAGGMNRALAATRSPIVLVMNPDVLFAEGCLERLIETLLSSESVGTVGPRGFLDEGRKIFLPLTPLPTLEDETTQFRGRFRRSISFDYSIARARQAHALNRSVAPTPVGMVPGCVMLLRRSTIEKIGFFDDRYPLFYEDSDLCRTLGEAGLSVLFEPRAEMTHFYSRSVASAPKSDDPMKRWWIARQRYFLKWYGPTGLSVIRRIASEIPRRARHAGRPATPCVDLGSNGFPTLFKFPRAVPEAMVEIALDSGFHLAASTYAQGDSWSFPPDIRMFFDTGVPVFVRALDVRDFSVLGTWMFRGR